MMEQQYYTVACDGTSIVFNIQLYTYSEQEYYTLTNYGTTTIYSVQWSCQCWWVRIIYSCAYIAMEQQYYAHTYI